MARPSMRRFFVQISVLWSAVLLTNAGFVFWLLLTSSLRAFVIERTIVSWALTAAAIGFSVLWFLRTMRRNDTAVRWGSATAAAPGLSSAANDGTA